jgi:hypothetical protein
VKEGEASLFRPENGSYKLVARVQMDEWPHIAEAAKYVQLPFEQILMSWGAV